jgi:hypothetical protein
MGFIQEEGLNCDLSFPWMRKATCWECSTEWNICTLCSSLRVHMIGPGSVQKRNRLCHKADQKAPKKRIRPAMKKKFQMTIDGATLQEQPDFSGIPQDAPDYEWMPAIPPTQPFPLQPGIVPTVPLMATTTTMTVNHPISTKFSDESFEFDNENSRNYFNQEIRD